ncbi:uncharacterized protein LOC129196693 isoform X2 [Grus americana]|uniref:uncharacterized protein LOC129196693 isoform X2 n=1 Tax=Grus americana TaxID=9117 RepID=UPI002408675A|nr:uncharacterized protein LOC129196693 isoform X2 [Grus americana]
MEAEGFALCHTPALQTTVFQYRIWDVNQKSLYLRNDQLVAGHLQGANAALEEKVFWVPNRAFEPSRLPVILGIQNGTRCLASPPASQPTLQLQPAAGDVAAPVPAAGRRHQRAAPRRHGLGRLHLLPLLQGRAVALRVGRQPRLVPLHLGTRPPAPGALPAPRCHPPPRLLLPALLNPPVPGDGDILTPGMGTSPPPAPQDRGVPWE